MGKKMVRTIKVVLALACISFASLAVSQNCKQGEKWVCKKIGNETDCACEWLF